MLCNHLIPPSPCSLFKPRSFFREWTRLELQAPWLEIPSFPTVLLEIRRNVLLMKHILSSDGQGPGCADPLTSPAWPHSWASSHVSMTLRVQHLPLTRNIAGEKLPCWTHPKRKPAQSAVHEPAGKMLEPWRLRNSGFLC